MHRIRALNYLPVLQDTECSSSGPEHVYLPLSRFPEGSLARLGAELKAFRAKNIPTTAIPASEKARRLENAARPPFRTPPVISRHDRDVFRYLWSKGIPIVIDNTPLVGDWSPSRFSMTHGAETVQIIDGIKAGTLKTTLSDFLDRFISAGADGKVIKLKVWASDSITIKL